MARVPPKYLGLHRPLSLSHTTRILTLTITLILHTHPRILRRLKDAGFVCNILSERIFSYTPLSCSVSFSLSNLSYFSCNDALPRVHNSQHNTVTMMRGIVKAQ